MEKEWDKKRRTMSGGIALSGAYIFNALQADNKDAVENEKFLSTLACHIQLPLVNTIIAFGLHVLGITKVFGAQLMNQ